MILRLVNCVLPQKGMIKFFFIDKGVLMRTIMFPISVNNDDEWLKSDQIVVPPKFREVILKRAHENAFFCSSGDRKKLLTGLVENFFWPKLKKDVVRYCKNMSPVSDCW